MSDQKNQLLVEVITQERKLLTERVDQISAPAVLGEVTILPGHMPLFTRLEDGILKLKTADQERELAIFGGFMDVGPGNRITVLADSAILSEDASEALAIKAKEKAQLAMEQKSSEVEFKMAESSLRKALLELKVAKRRRQSAPINP